MAAGAGDAPFAVGGEPMDNQKQSTTQCANCGMEIKDQKQLVQRNNQSFCCDACADKATQKV